MVSMVLVVLTAASPVDGLQCGRDGVMWVMRGQWCVGGDPGMLVGAEVGVGSVMWCVNEW